MFFPLRNTVAAYAPRVQSRGVFCLMVGLLIVLVGAGFASAQPGTVLAEQKISDTDGGFTGTLDNYDEFGSCVAPLGDLDGDGFCDVVVGAPKDDDGAPGGGRGAVWVLFLNADGTVKSHQKISDTDGGFTGTLDNYDYFGSAVAALGDLDGDEVEDIAVSAISDDDGGTNFGAVWVLFLNTNGTVKSYQKISAAEGGFGGTLDVNDYFGGSLARLGDLDGDGVEDLAVGVDRDDDGGSDRGAVWVLFLNTDGTVKADQKISDTEGNFTGILSDSDHFGCSIAHLGDLDGDGYTELAVGADDDDEGGDRRGAVWVLSLTSTGTVASHQKISSTQGGFTGVLDNASYFGCSVAALGDVDADSVPDLGVGAFNDDDGVSQGGAVWVLFLNDDGTVKSHQKISATQGGFTGPLQSGDKMGTSLACLGDYDGDGFSDIVAGAPTDDDGGSDRGSIWLLYLDGELPPTCDVSPTSIDFGSVGIGGSAEDTFTITNSGGGTLTGNVTESCDHYEIVSGGGAFALGPAEDLVVTVRFEPTTDGTHLCTVDLGTGLCPGVDLTGVGDVSAPVCEVFPSSLDFDLVTVGSFVDQTFTVQNIGGGSLDGFVDIFSTHYEIIAGAGAFSLGTGEALEVTVRFEPEQTGILSDLVELGNIGCSNVSVTGRGASAGAMNQVILDSWFNVSGLDAGDHFGGGAAGIGDLDGDSVPDMVVGAPSDDDGGTDRGAVHVVFMNRDRTARTTQKISDTVGGFTGVLDDGDWFGHSVAGLGDLDGDGFEDIVVGAPYDDDLNTDAGAIWVLFLNGDGTVKAHQKISSSQGGFTVPLGPADWFGMSVAQIGDFDGDGVADLAVGCPGDDDGGSQHGAVRVLHLHANGMVKSNRKISDLSGGFTGVLDDGDYFGSSVAAIGDHDGDGFTDLVVGAKLDDDGGDDRGAVWLLFLEEYADVKAHQKISSTTGGFTGVALDRLRFGASAAFLGDQDADGIGDLVVGAPSYYGAASGDPGAVWVLFLNPDGTVKSDFEITEGSGGFTGDLEPRDNFGYAIANIGDLDGNGFTDLGVGAPYAGASDYGRMWKLYMGDAPLPPSCDVTPASLDFGPVEVGSVGPPQSFTITNDGLVAFSGFVSESCDHYMLLGGSGPYTLDPGQSHLVSVMFFPLAPGTHDCTIQTGAAACGDVEVAGVGSGPACSVSPNPLDFGRVIVGDYLDLVFTITNEGQGELTGDVSLQYEEGFSILAGAGPFSLAAGEQWPVTVRFEPAMYDIQFDNVLLGDNLCDDVELVGFGATEPICEVSPEVWNMPPFSHGGAQPYGADFTITNTGDEFSAPLTGNVSESCDLWELWEGAGPFSLLGGEQLTVGLYFDPPQAGYYECTVETGQEICSDVIYMVTVLPETLHVPSEYTTIQAAVDVAAPGDVVMLAPDQPYEGPGNRDVVIDKSITVMSTAGFYDRPWIDCGGTPAEPHRAFWIDNDCAPTIHGLRIENGYAPEGGGVFVQPQSTLTIEDCTIMFCHAENSGGGIYCAQYASAIVESFSVYSCTAPDGGGISVGYNGSLTMQGASVDDCWATDGDGGGINGYMASIAADGLWMFSCYATGNGGAIAMLGGSASLEISESTLFANSADGHGAGVYSGSGMGGCYVDISNSRILDSWSGGSWGAEGVYIASQPYAFIDSTFLYRSSFHAASEECAFEITSSTIYGASCIVDPGSYVSVSRSILWNRDGNCIENDAGTCALECSDTGGSIVGAGATYLDPDCFSIDPLLCLPRHTSPDGSIDVASACLPEHTPCGFPVGSGDSGCEGGSDHDYIDYDVDLDGSEFSDAFSDVDLGGLTEGTVTFSGDQILVVADDADPEKGIRVLGYPTGGSAPDTVRVCGCAEVRMYPYSEVVLTGLPYAEDSGRGTRPVQVEVDGPVVGYFTFYADEVEDGTITALATNYQPVTVTINGGDVLLAPGESAPVPAGGVVTAIIQNHYGLAFDSGGPRYTHLVPEEHGTIQEAVDAAAPGDIVSIDPAFNPYTGPRNWDILIDKDITIEARPGAGRQWVIIDAYEEGVDHRGLEVVGGDGQIVRIVGIRIENGAADRGGCVNIAGEASDSRVQVVMEDCVLLDGTADNGGLLYLKYASVTLTDCGLVGGEANSTVAGFGGGVYGSDSDFTMEGCDVSDCAAEGAGGGLYLDECDVDISDSSISDNWADTSAGGVWLAWTWEVPWANISGTAFKDNVAENELGNHLVVLALENVAALGEVNIQTSAFASPTPREGIWYRTEAELHLQASSLYNSSVRLRSESQAFLDHVILWNPLGEYLVNDGTAELSCCNFAGAVSGEGTTQQDNCLSIDPLFCFAFPYFPDLLSVDAASVCLAENNPLACGQIGAHGNGCEGGPDGDYIDTDVDPLPDDFSDAFSHDTTEGTVTFTGDQVLIVSEHSDPDTDIRVWAYPSGGAEPDFVTVCECSEFEMNAGAEVLLACNPSSRGLARSSSPTTVEVVSGPVAGTFTADNGGIVTASIEGGYGLEFDPGASSTITALPGNPGPMAVSINGQEVPLDPGESAPVPPPPDIDVTPTSLSFTVLAGAVECDSLVLHNLGLSELTWSVTEVEGTLASPARTVRAVDGVDAVFGGSVDYREDVCAWLSAVPDTGTIAPADSQIVAVCVDAAALTGGSYSCDLVFESNDPDEPEVTVPVSLTVEGVTTAIIDTNPDHIDGGWQMTGPGGYDVSASGDTTLTGLVPGEYTCTWFPDTSGGGWQMPDPVTQTIAQDETVTFTGDYWQAPDVDIQPMSLTFEVPIDGSDCANLEISNWGSMGAIDLLWIVSHGDCTWLSENPTSGAVAQAETDTVEICVDATGLSQGTYDCELVFDTNDGDELQVIVPVSLTVAADATAIIDTNPDNIDGAWQMTGPGGYDLSASGDTTLTSLVPGEYTCTWFPDTSGGGWQMPDPVTQEIPAGETVTFTGNYWHRPDIDIQPMSLEFEVDEGDTDCADLGISNWGSMGAMDLIWSVEHGDCTWLSEDPTSGAVPQGETHIVEICVDATSLTEGEYDCELVFYAPDDDDEPETHVPVALTVNPETGIEDDPAFVPAEFKLWAAVPNPFNPRTTIRYDLPEPATVRLTIYDIRGRLVRVLEDGVAREPGRHAVVWNGCDDHGYDVSSGVFVYRLEAGSFEGSGRMTLLR